MAILDLGTVSAAEISPFIPTKAEYGQDSFRAVRPSPHERFVATARFIAEEQLSPLPETRPLIHSAPLDSSWYTLQRGYPQTRVK